MTALARFYPLHRRVRFGVPTLLDDWFREAAMGSPWRDSDVVPEIRLDITEDEKTYSIKAEVPGVDKGDIEVSVEGNQVAISAELKREGGKNGEKEIVAERSFGRAYRSFTLPGEVDPKRTEARYDKGVLTLTLPKKADGMARRIAVS